MTEKNRGELGGDYARDTHREGFGDDYARDGGWSGAGSHEDHVREPENKDDDPEKTLNIRDTHVNKVNE
jgi:hypothetical protein